MTIPIARLVATRYARTSRRSGSATSRTPTARSAAARAAARVPPGGRRADRRARPGRDGRGDRGSLVRGARRGGADATPDRARRRRPVPRAARRAGVEVPTARARRCSRRSSRHDLVGLGREVGGARARRRARDAAARCRSCAAAPRCSSGARARRRRGARRRLARGPRALERRGVADRVDLRPRARARPRLLHGAIFEVYDPALGHVLGGGGRYDELIGRFGRPLPACGFALYVERLHVAQAERGARAMRRP